MSNSLVSSGPVDHGTLVLGQFAYDTLRIRDKDKFSSTFGLLVGPEDVLVVLEVAGLGPVSHPWGDGFLISALDGDGNRYYRVPIAANAPGRWKWNVTSESARAAYEGTVFVMPDQMTD